MYGYIYKITNLINNKIYIGKRVSNKLDNSYWGSGKILQEAYIKYGKENFKRELIEECDTKQQLNEREKFWIAKLHSQDREIGYNISAGGDGFDWESHSDEYKQAFGPKMSKVNKGRIKTDTWCKNLSKSLSGREFSATHRQHLSEAAKARKRSECSAETRQKISRAHKGKTVSDETRLAMSLAKRGVAPWNKGKKTGPRAPMTGETKRKIAKATGKAVICINNLDDTQLEFSSISETIRYFVTNYNYTSGQLYTKFRKLTQKKINSIIIENYCIILQTSI